MTELIDRARVLVNMGLTPRYCRNNLTMWQLTENLKIPIKTTMTVNSREKLVLSGNYVIDYHDNCIKYPPEVVTSTWSLKEPYLEYRPVNDGYSRTETAQTVYDYFLTNGLATERLKILYPEEYANAQIEIDQRLIKGTN